MKSQIASALVVLLLAGCATEHQASQRWQVTAVHDGTVAILTDTQTGDTWCSSGQTQWYWMKREAAGTKPSTASEPDKQSQANAPTTAPVFLHDESFETALPPRQVIQALEGAGTQLYMQHYEDDPQSRGSDYFFSQYKLVSASGCKSVCTAQWVKEGQTAVHLKSDLPKEQLALLIQRFRTNLEMMDAKPEK